MKVVEQVSELKVELETYCTRTFQALSIDGKLPKHIEEIDPVYNKFKNASLRLQDYQKESHFILWKHYKEVILQVDQEEVLGLQNEDQINMFYILKE